jgi:hypothetical protein
MGREPIGVDKNGYECTKPERVRTESCGRDFTDDGRHCGDATVATGNR